MVKKSIIILAFFFILLGVIYPLTIMLIANLISPFKANGSLIYDQNNQLLGSQLIAQSFISDKYLWSRPSVNDFNMLQPPKPNMTMSSAQTPQFIARQQEKGYTLDGLFQSKSGLDPHITLENALQQAARIAESRKCDHQQIIKLIYGNTIKKLWPSYKYVNVLMFNLELDKFSTKNCDG